MRARPTKYVFVTGGVVSSLGKGITAASLGRLLKARGLRVQVQKFDPYMAFRIMAEMKVRNAFIPPTALRLLKAVENPREIYDLV